MFPLNYDICWLFAVHYSSANFFKWLKLKCITRNAVIIIPWNNKHVWFNRDFQISQECIQLFANILLFVFDKIMPAIICCSPLYFDNGTRLSLCLYNNGLSDLVVDTRSLLWFEVIVSLDFRITPQAENRIMNMKRYFFMIAYNLKALNVLKAPFLNME